METQTTLRDQLESAFDSAEAGTLEPVQNAPEIESEPVVETRPRDEKGRFVEKKTDDKAPDIKADVDKAEPVQAEPEKPQLARPTTWKKDYLPIWDKLATGTPLTPDEALKLAEYSNQRENEYKTGVSTYKAEAQNAKALQDAMAPFIPILQQHNIQPTQWIQNLGRAHHTLAMGTPQQKLQMFAQLAQEYGVPLEAVGMAQQGQLDPIVPSLMAQIQELSGKVNTVANWREQQEQQTIQNELARFQDTAKYPYFEQVRETMAQLLETGFTQDLDTAYQKAIRMNDDVFNSWQTEQLRTHEAEKSKAQAVVKAKAHAVSPKSATPSGKIGSEPKDRRAILEQQFEEVDGRV